MSHTFLSIASKNSLTEVFALELLFAIVTLQPRDSFVHAILFSHRHYWQELRVNCVIWRRRVAMCCNAHVACTFKMSPNPAISENQAVAVQHVTGIIGS